ELPEPMLYKVGAVAYPRGHILHDFLEARVFPRIVGPVGPGRLQYTAMWKTAQRMTKKPVKFGTILPELIAVSVTDDYYKDPVELKAIGQILKDKKIVIGVIDHHTLQVERPDDIAALIREALKYIPPERLIISSDCGMGREGMGRRHAAYKMVAMVLGTNIVRQELGLPQAQCLAADGRYSLTISE